MNNDKKSIDILFLFFIIIFPSHHQSSIPDCLKEFRDLSDFKFNQLSND